MLEIHSQNIFIVIACREYPQSRCLRDWNVIVHGLNIGVKNFWNLYKEAVTTEAHLHLSPPHLLSETLHCELRHPRELKGDNIQSFQV